MTVEIRDAVRRFGGAIALDGVNLFVDNGAFVALLGPSGSGKTTLLRIIAGLDMLDGGSLIVGGRNMAGIPARERGVGVVFQHYALFRHMTVFENVAFGLRVRPRANRPVEAEITRRVNALLDLVQIPELARRLPDQVSGGQRQRVALARALAIEPQLLLLDEPFGALDAIVRKEVRRWLRGLHDRLGITSILVTHDQDEAMELADRVAVMESGRVAQFDTPAMLLSRPANPFVAGFLGERARIPCVIAGHEVRFAGMPSIALTAALPDGDADAFIAPGDLIADPAQGAASPTATIIRVRPGLEMSRAVVSIGELMLEATLAPGGEAASTGTTATLRLRRAIVFPRDPRHAGMVALALPRV